MPWFRLDDAFHSHPKVIAAGNEAAGLYVRCGAYAAQHLTDGFVPEHIAHLYGGLDVRRGSDETLVATLVRTRLWRRARKGWRMPDYLDYNPSREEVLLDRKRSAERQAKWREKKKHAGQNTSRNGVSNGVSNAAPTPPRPDPVGVGSGRGDNSPSVTRDGPVDNSPCPHGADRRRLCALCRRGIEEAG